jgi:hypothetical protein
MEVSLFRLLAFALVALCTASSVFAQDDKPSGYTPHPLGMQEIVDALRSKADMLEMRLSGNRGARWSSAAFKPAWAPRDRVEQELWVYGGSARNRIALAAKIAKRVEMTLNVSELPIDLIADEVQIITPIRLYRDERSEKHGSGEELLNVSLKPNVELVRQFEPDAEYRRLLALPPDWDLRVYAYAPKSVEPGTAVNVFFTKTKKKDAFNAGHLR